MNDDYGVAVLGDSFLRQYVASFNYADKTVTLGKSVNAPQKPETANDLNHILIIIVICTLLVLIIVAIIVILTFCKYRKRKTARYATYHYDGEARNAEERS